MTNLEKIKLDFINNLIQEWIAEQQEDQPTSDTSETVDNAIAFINGKYEKLSEVTEECRLVASCQTIKSLKTFYTALYGIDIYKDLLNKVEL